MKIYLRKDFLLHVSCIKNEKCGMRPRMLLMYKEPLTKL